MTSFVFTKYVEAPPQTVFDVAADLEHAAEHVRGIEKIEMLTPPPVGVGTRWRETRKMMGKLATETLEVKAFDRPRKYVVGCESCGCYFESTFTFAPRSSGTAVTLDVHTKALTLMARIMSPIGNMMMGKTMRKLLDDDLEDVKRVAESRAGAPVTP
jgi:hypothetical protein